MSTNENLIYHDIQNRVMLENKSDDTVIEQKQHIPTAFLDGLRKQREDSLNQVEGEFMSVAEVPVSVYEQWLREGFDMMKENPKAILMRLKQQDLGAFITTKKQV
jgi:hypothetical protein|tara:strand:- start:640 stop:954 length:315 start_codon:yes stop_codon:yes gene_type:complete